MKEDDDVVEISVSEVSKMTYSAFAIGLFCGGILTIGVAVLLAWLAGA